MNDGSRALLDCFTLGELQLLSAIYHHLSRLETKRRSPKEKKIPVKWFWSLGVPQSSPTFVGKERVTKLQGRLHRRLCLRRLNFKTHFLRVRRAKHWANESGYSVCKKNTQSKTVGYKTLPISDPNVWVKSISYFRFLDLGADPPRIKLFGVPPVDFPFHWLQWEAVIGWEFQSRRKEKIDLRSLFVTSRKSTFSGLNYIVIWVTWAVMELTLNTQDIHLDLDFLTVTY